jgi:hypothetical protein
MKLFEVGVHLKEHEVCRKFVLCLPGSDASIERAFSCMNYIRSEGKSRFHVDLTQAILAVKSNTDLSCEAFNKNLKINSSDKYHVIIRTSSLK